MISVQQLFGCAGKRGAHHLLPHFMGKVAGGPRSTKIGLRKLNLGLFYYLLLFVQHLLLVLQDDLLGAFQLRADLLLQDCFFGVAEDVSELAGRAGSSTGIHARFRLLVWCALLSSNKLLGCWLGRSLFPLCLAHARAELALGTT